MGRCLWLLVACIAVSSTILGCKGGSSDGPATVNASGVVTLDGAPVEGAQVVFVDDANRYPAYGPTDSSGRFSLQLSDEKKGAVPGSYKISVSKTIQETLGGTTTTGGPDVMIKYGLPKKYDNFMTSGLSFTVPAEGTSNIKLELSSKEL